MVCMCVEMHIHIFRSHSLLPSSLLNILCLERKCITIVSSGDAKEDSQFSNLVCVDSQMHAWLQDIIKILNFLRRTEVQKLKK